MTTRVIFILAILCTATVFGDSARENKGPSTMDAETERLVYPEISYARAVAKGRGGPAEPRQRAQEAVERWDNGTLDPEPILLEAWLQEGRRDEYSGRMMYGLMGEVSAEAPAVLNLFVVDEDRDLLGVRIHTALEHTQALLRRRGREVDLATIPLDDPQVYRLLRSTQTVGRRS